MTGEGKSVILLSEAADGTFPQYELPLDKEETMDNKYAGTQTEKNLEAAFAGESQARNKYTYFASVAKKEGYEQIAALFLKTADNETELTKLALYIGNYPLPEAGSLFYLCSGSRCMPPVKSLEELAGKWT